MGAVFNERDTQLCARLRYPSDLRLRKSKVVNDQYRARLGAHALAQILLVNRQVLGDPVILHIHARINRSLNLNAAMVVREPGCASAFDPEAAKRPINRGPSAGEAPDASGHTGIGLPWPAQQGAQARSWKGSEYDAARHSAY
jgi:hypothetical protein